MGATRGPVNQSGQERELTTQEQARRDWIHEQRGTKPSEAPAETPDKPRMAGSRIRGLMGWGGGALGGVLNAMTGGRGRATVRRGGGRIPYRSREVQDWIDTQRGVELQPRDNQSPFRGLFGMRTTADRQRYQDRNAWIDEQIRKGKLELPELKPEEVE